MIEEFDPMNDPMVAKAKEREEALKKKEIKKEILNNLKIDNNGISFDADRIAIGNMTAVTAIANWKFNQAIGGSFKLVANQPNTTKTTKNLLTSLGDIFDTIYQKVYNTNIPWKGADDKIHQIHAETVAESLEKAMHKLAQVVTNNTEEDTNED